MLKITSNTVPCSVTATDMGRIWWAWRQGYWVIAVKPVSSLAQKRHDPNRHG